MSFIVDTAGRVDVATIRNMRAADRTNLSSPIGGAYEALVAAVRKGLATARYEPARLGGCPVRTWVQQAFDLRRAP
jgi:hypothetical protein